MIEMRLHGNRVREPQADDKITYAQGGHRLTGAGSRFGSESREPAKGGRRDQQPLFGQIYSDKLSRPPDPDRSFSSAV